MFSTILRILTISTIMSYLWSSKRVAAQTKQEPRLTKMLPPQFRVIYQPGNDKVSIFAKNTKTVGTFWALPDMCLEYDEDGNIARIDIWHASEKKGMVPRS